MKLLGNKPALGALTLGLRQKATAFFSEFAMASTSTLPLLPDLLPGEAGKNKQKSLLELIWTVRPVGREVAVGVAMLVVVGLLPLEVLGGTMSQMVPLGSSTHWFVKRLQQLLYE
jgi:hypothetical protein